MSALGNGPLSARSEAAATQGAKVWLAMQPGIREFVTPAPSITACSSVSESPPEFSAGWFAKRAVFTARKLSGST